MCASVHMCECVSKGKRERKRAQVCIQVENKSCSNREQQLAFLCKLTLTRNSTWLLGNSIALLLIVALGRGACRSAISAGVCVCTCVHVCVHV